MELVKAFEFKMAGVKFKMAAFPVLFFVCFLLYHEVNSQNTTAKNFCTDDKGKVTKPFTQFTVSYSRIKFVGIIRK